MQKQTIVDLPRTARNLGGLAMRRGSRAVLLGPVRSVNSLLRRSTARVHRFQYRLEWRTTPTPEWFDHYLDSHWHWSATGQSLFAERGVFDSLAIEPGASVLELCCGDGFNAKHFYAFRAANVVAVDFDQGAIHHARRRNAAPNIRYEIMDIRYELPSGDYDNVIWDAAIEHFTDEEIQAILTRIKSRLKHGTGLLSGYTLLERESGVKHIPQHEREFRSKADLMSFLTKHFSHAAVFETVYPERVNLYFYASDIEHVIPFAGSHPRFLWASETGTPDQAQ